MQEAQIAYTPTGRAKGSRPIRPSIGLVFAEGSLKLNDQAT